MSQDLYTVRDVLTQGIGILKNATFDGGYWRGNGWRFYGPKQVAFTAQEALEKADQIRQKKIANLEKQIAKLEKQIAKLKAMEFQIPPLPDPNQQEQKEGV